MLQFQENCFFIGGKNKKVGMYNFLGIKKWECNVNNNHIPTCVDRLDNIVVSASSLESMKYSKKDHAGEIKVWDISQGKSLYKVELY